MTTLNDVESIIQRLGDLRGKVAERQDELRDADQRTEDIAWPCAAYENVGAAVFDSDNACLVAEPPSSTLWLSRPILEDLIKLLPEALRGPASDWFFLHQLVHVAQGLGYHDFRVLNRVGNRHETMRADCDADFASLKTLALMMCMDERAHSTDPTLGSPHVRHLQTLLDDLLPSMIQMDPNIFIPRNRDIEIRRIFALLLLRYYYAEAATHNRPAPNSSIFPWWSDDFSECYVFVGQVNALGRGRVRIDQATLRLIIDHIRSGDVDGAYKSMSEFDWPPLDPDTLPSRLIAR